MPRECWLCFFNSRVTSGKALLTCHISKWLLVPRINRSCCVKGCKSCQVYILPRTVPMSTFITFWLPGNINWNIVIALMFVHLVFKGIFSNVIHLGWFEFICIFGSFVYLHLFVCLSIYLLICWDMESHTKQACYTKLSLPSFFPFSFWDRVSLTKLPGLLSTWTPSLLGCCIFL